MTSITTGRRGDDARATPRGPAATEGTEGTARLGTGTPGTGTPGTGTPGTGTPGTGNGGGPGDPVKARARTDAAPPRKDRTHWLYVAVVVAVLAGIAVGFLAPDFAKGLKLLGTGF